MKIEKFSADGINGYKIIGSTFASSRNQNGAYFDPVEVFSLDNPPSKFNLGHKDYETDYSSGTTITRNPEGSIDGKMLRFTWDLETTNENFINLIESDNFGGFSPELSSRNKPIRSENGERFYRQGDLEWFMTAILLKDQKPGFVGANEYVLEKFEAFEDVVIKKDDDEKPNDEVKEAEPKTEDKEEFSLSEELRSQLLYLTNQVKDNNETIKDLQVAIASLQSAPKPQENFEDKNEKLEKEKFEKMKLETEHFNTIAKAKAEIDDIKLVQHGVEAEKPMSKEAEDEAKTSLIKKIF